MHDDCKIFAEALIAATGAIKQTNESVKASRDREKETERREKETEARLYSLNSKLIVTIIAVAAIIVTGFVVRDYIQYTAVYDGVNQTQMTITGSNNKIKEGSGLNGNSTKTPKKSSTYQETILDSADN